MSLKNAKIYLISLLIIGLKNFIFFKIKIFKIKKYK